MVGIWHDDWVGGLRIREGFHPPCVSCFEGQAVGHFGNRGGQRPGDCLTLMYVRDDSHRGLLFQERDAGQLAGGIYDVFHSPESTADCLQCSIGRNRSGRADCLLFCGTAAGLLLHVLYRGTPFFDFSGFEEPKSRDTDPRLLQRYLKNLWRNVKATGVYFLMGILLSALFQRYVPAEVMTALFGGNEALGVLMAATVGVPLYACGGGTIPLLQQWLWEGMSVGSACLLYADGPGHKDYESGRAKDCAGSQTIFPVYRIRHGILPVDGADCKPDSIKPDKGNRIIFNNEEVVK